MRLRGPQQRPRDGQQGPRLAAERSHGNWYLRLELGTGTDGRRRDRRGGFRTRKSAQDALARLHGTAGSPLTVDEGTAVICRQPQRRDGRLTVGPPKTAHSTPGDCP